MCSPSKACIYTSLHNNTNGILNNTANYHKPAEQLPEAEKEQFPEQYRILAQMDPQSLGGKVPALELYALQTDPDEMHNLADNAAARVQRDRLYAALRNWSVATGDTSAPLPVNP